MFSTKRISEFYHYKRVLHKDVIGYISELHGWYPAKAGRDVIMTGYLLLIKTVSFRFFFSQNVDICNSIAFVQLISIYTKSFMFRVCI